MILKVLTVSVSLGPMLALRLVLAFGRVWDAGNPALPLGCDIAVEISCRHGIPACKVKVRLAA